MTRTQVNPQANIHMNKDISNPPSPEETSVPESTAPAADASSMPDPITSSKKPGKTRWRKAVLPLGCGLTLVLGAYLAIQGFLFVWHTGVNLLKGNGFTSKPVAEQVNPQQATAASPAGNRDLEEQLEALKKENERLKQGSVSRTAPETAKQAASGEPTEAEMRQAIQNRIDSINQNLATMRNTRPDPNNPISGLMALGGMLLGDTKYYIGDFKKIGAEKAQGKPGYMCDYMLQLRVDGETSAPVDSIMKFGGSLCTARFVKLDGAWVWIAPGDEKS